MFEIREANLDDSKDILNWRNNEDTRKMSKNSNVIDIQTHDKWFTSVLNQKDNFMYIAENNIGKIGMCRIQNTQDNNYEVSINLNPRFRGCHYSERVLKHTLDKTKLKLQPNCILIAYIRNINVASKIIFEKCGFVKTMENENGFEKYILNV